MKLEVYFTICLLTIFFRRPVDGAKWNRVKNCYVDADGNCKSNSADGTVEDKVSDNVGRAQMDASNAADAASHHNSAAAREAADDAAAAEQAARDIAALATDPATKIAADTALAAASMWHTKAETSAQQTESDAAAASGAQAVRDAEAKRAKDAAATTAAAVAATVKQSGNAAGGGDSDSSASRQFGIDTDSAAVGLRFMIGSVGGAACLVVYVYAIFLDI